MSDITINFVDNPAPITVTIVGQGSSGGTIRGTTGTTNNAILVADGTGGFTAKGSLGTLDGSGNLAVAAVATGASGLAVNVLTTVTQIFQNAFRYFNGTTTGTLQFGSVTNNPVITLPNATGTVMLNPATAQGDLFYWNGTAMVALSKGTVGQVLTMNADETAPEWV